MSKRSHVHLDLELVDLVAGEVGPARRRLLLDEVRRCDVCRARADELVAATGDVVAAAPAVTPPLGFETRVASRLAEAAPATTTGPRAKDRRRWWVAAAASLVLIVAAGALALAVRDDAGDGGGGGEVLALVRNGSDDAVGTVTFGEAADGPVMVVALLDAPADVAYRCRMHLVDGTLVDSAPWPPSRRGAWILDVPGSIDDVARVEIVADDTDTVWASASR